MSLFRGWQVSKGFSGKLLPVTPLNSRMETKIKINGEYHQILVDTRATLSTWNPTHSGTYKLDSRKMGRSWRRVRIPTRVSSSRFLSVVLSQEEGKILHCFFLFKYKPIDYRFCHSDEQLLPYVSSFMSWDHGLATIRSKVQKVRLDRNVGCIPVSARDLPTVASW